MSSRGPPHRQGQPREWHQTGPARGRAHHPAGTGPRVGEAGDAGSGGRAGFFFPSEATSEDRAYLQAIEAAGAGHRPGGGKATVLVPSPSAHDTAPGSMQGAAGPGALDFHLLRAHLPRVSADWPGPSDGVAAGPVDILIDCGQCRSIDQIVSQAIGNMDRSRVIFLVAVGRAIPNCISAASLMQAQRLCTIRDVDTFTLAGSQPPASSSTPGPPPPPPPLLANTDASSEGDAPTGRRRRKPPATATTGIYVCLEFG
ncbi:hypothetical protein H696_01864 [Fonticula alba]|uniref:Uncharacterized protein n=1 Tax=Fonticula alba TaxID=691883 RepID=A0A058ZBW3_FONAL|nr:hypothetical protein H696_01864 [Fonticula alba]KCV70917.1 hypothetical protein H696_01864 [Fonticula alba]|eukprot:XP_009494040.1 hypothetical protein H696_01864 [Fonticula alba]